MKAFSLKIVTHPIESNESAKVLSVFLFRSGVTDNEIDNEIVEILSHESIIDAIHFIGYKDCISQIPSWFSNGTALDARLRKFAENLEDKIKLITFDETTGLHVALKLDLVTVLSQTIVATEKRFSLQYLFEKNHGLIEPLKGFHYEKPSEKHVEKFIRTSNLLEEQEAYFLIAFWLMPHIWNKNITEIIVDTTGILPIAITLAYENQYRGSKKYLPLIWSHQSYGGLESLNVIKPDETLIFISASTSGGLREKLLEKGGVSENIITLFYCGHLPDNESILCDLTKNEITNPNGLPILKNFEKDGCPLCLERSLSVRLVGDQFLFEPPPIKEVNIFYSDLPDNDREIIDRLSGINFFKVYKSMGVRDLEIFLDVEKLFPSDYDNIHVHNLEYLKSLRKTWEGIVNRGLVVNLKKIISASYDFSDVLAESALSILSQYHTNSSVRAIKSKDLSNSDVEAEAASLIVVACLDDAHELMGISRDLRTIHPAGNATYISPIIRSSSKLDKNRLKSNLTFGQNKFDTFSLFRVLEIDLPECIKENSWYKELEFFRKLIDWALINNKSISVNIEERIKFLEDTPAIGMTEKLFWNSPADIPLKIRSDFTLLNTYGGERKISQADVFVAITACLHHLRKGSSGKRLAYHPYERAVIAPHNFQRFNDGVVQSAILRAARNQELCYSNCEDKISNQMKEHLLLQIEKHQSGDGEALMEFILALATKRLSLKRIDKQEVCNALLTSSLGDHFKLIAEYLNEDPN